MALYNNGLSCELKPNLYICQDHKDTKVSLRNQTGENQTPSPFSSSLCNISNFIDGSNAQAAFHFAANPNIRGTAYRTWFSIYKWQNNQWDQKFYGTRARLVDSLAPSTQSFENDQHMYVSYAWNQARGITNASHVYELWPGFSANGIPAIAASYRENNDATMLEYRVPNAAEYYVSEYHGGGTEFTYQGPACRILVPRRLNQINEYNVSVRYQGQGGWSNPSLWLDLHY